MRDAIAAHLGSRGVSRVLYGSILGLALVVALEHHPPRSIAIAVTLVSTAIAAALAEFYSELVGTETRTRSRVTREGRVEIRTEVAATAVGVGFSSAFFFLAALGAFDRDAAFALAKWSGLGLIATYGFAAARLSGDTVVGSLWRAALAALIASFLIAIKAVLH